MTRNKSRPGRKLRSAKHDDTDAEIELLPAAVARQEGQSARKGQADAESVSKREIALALLPERQGPMRWSFGLFVPQRTFK
jgi:hypothetical protein